MPHNVAVKLETGRVIDGLVCSQNLPGNDISVCLFQYRPKEEQVYKVDEDETLYSRDQTPDVTYTFSA